MVVVSSRAIKTKAAKDEVARTVKREAEVLIATKQKEMIGRMDIVSQKTVRKAVASGVGIERSRTTRPRLMVMTNVEEKIVEEKTVVERVVNEMLRVMKLVRAKPQRSGKNGTMTGMDMQAKTVYAHMVVKVIVVAKGMEESRPRIIRCCWERQFRLPCLGYQLR